MSFHPSLEGSVATLRLDGRLTFERHRDFKEQAYPLIDNPEVRTIELDLGGVTYMDSSTLGMLLLLREKADSKGIRVRLLKPGPSVTNILKVVHFDRLFEIQS